MLLPIHIAARVIQIFLQIAAFRSGELSIRFVLAFFAANTALFTLELARFMRRQFA